VCSTLGLVNCSSILTTFSAALPRSVDKPMLVVLNVHRERSRNPFVDCFCAVGISLSLTKQVSETASRANFAQVWFKKEAVFPSSASTSAQAEHGPSSSTNTVPSSPRARKNTLTSPVRNLAGPSKTRAIGGAPPRLRFAKRSMLQASKLNPSPPLDYPAKCTGPSCLTKTTKSSALL
jgi:hypothetical protein